MSIFKVESISGKSMIYGFFFLIFAALAVAGCAKESSGTGSSADVQPKTAQVAQAETSKPDAAMTKEERAAAIAAIKVKVGDPVAGQLIYNKYCHFCHGKKGMGDGPIGIAIKPSPADLIHDRYRVLKTDKQLYYSISEGVRRPKATEMVMPRWKEVLTEQQRWDVLAYVRQLEDKYSSKKLLKERDASNVSAGH